MEDLVGYLKEAKARAAVSKGRRRSSVSLEGGVEMMEREFTTSTMSQPGPGQVQPADLPVDHRTPNMSGTVAEAVIEEWSLVPTDTTVAFEPKLEGGVLKDGVVLKDRVRNTRGLGSFVESFLQPIGAFLLYIPCILLPAWGPFAIAGLTSTSLGDGTEGITRASLVIMALCGLGAVMLYLIMFLDCHAGTVRLILRNAKLGLLLTIGTRLVYTITGLMRLTEEGYKAVFGGAVTGFVHGMVYVFVFIFEMCRHFAIIKLLDGSDAVNVVAVLPARWFGSQLVVTNVNLMNVCFTTSMILLLRTALLTYGTGGKRFVVLSTPINLKPVYALKT
ncbi:hypothetical protein TeGR_g4571 [Tetraparma gracilis]|uniref:Uncharacterized protein n=1 Tax=Tetraparma gracilis TaxID=2962635 RepID=A0ABQ6MI91_9STRA|nr:hypothetical protein TeGR_g4571 [Tetraparma gracilis]